jgi:hypothetical protein
MNNYKIVILLLLSMTASGFSQKSLNDYSFVSVPEVYEFLSEKDKYQLNSLTKFLFNKYGFNAYIASELPNVKRCEGLYSEVHNNSGFIYTKLTVVLKDCNGVEVFKSPEGKSKLKSYKEAYHQALREAFTGIEDLNVNQRELIVYEETYIPETDSEKEVAVSLSGNIPSAKYSNYTKDGRSYLLRKTATGFSLYEESAEAEDGLLLIGIVFSEGEAFKFKAASETLYNASFDDSYNLIVQSDTEGQQIYRAIR